MLGSRFFKAGFGVFLILYCAQANDDLHIFTDHQDRVVAARILKMDSRRGLVELERENKRRIKVKPSIFIEADQAYIHDWCLGQAFMTAFGLKFSGKKSVVDEWEERSGAIKRDFKKVSYDCEFKNGSSYIFENLEVKYCVYWVQEMITRGGEDRLDKTYAGQYEISKMKSHEKVSFLTDPITLMYQHLQGSYYYSGGAPDKQSSKMKGVWLKVSITTESGDTFTRDFCEPADIMKYQVWKEVAAKNE